MVAVDDGHAHLLRGRLGRTRSDDDFGVEVVFDPIFEANFPDLPDLDTPFDEISAPPEKEETEESEPQRRTRIFKRIRTKVFRRVRSIRGKRSFNVEEDKENNNFSGNLSPSRTSNTTNISSYDERSILDTRDPPPNDDELYELESTVSSVFSTASNQKSQRRFVSHLKSCMSSSVRRIMRKDSDDELKGQSSRYKDFGLFIDPPESNFYISKDRRRSAFALLVPSLETPAQSRDESNAADYNPGDDFPLKSQDEIAILEAELQNTAPSESQRQTKPEIVQHKVKLEKNFQPPSLRPKKSKSSSSLFVSFDEDMAQLIFDAPSSETETEAFQTVDVHSVESDIKSLSDEDDDSEHFTITYPAYNVGAAFSHPGVPQPSTISMATSTETELTTRPLGISCGHPNYYSNHREEEQSQVWSQVESANMEGYVTDPPSPVPVRTTRDDYWCLGQANSNESDLTMTDVLLNKHGYFPTDFASALPDLLGSNVLGDCYPYDELEGQQGHDDYGVRRQKEGYAPYDEVERKSAFSTVQRRPEQAASTTMEQYLHRGALAAFGTDRQEQQYSKSETAATQRRPDPPTTTMAEYLQRGALAAFSTEREEEQHSRDEHRLSFRERAKRDKVTCRCVKCTAASIYQDLLHCQGGSVD